MIVLTLNLGVLSSHDNLRRLSFSHICSQIASVELKFSFYGR